MELPDLLDYALSTLAITGVPDSPHEFLEEWRDAPVDREALDGLLERARVAENAGARGIDVLRVIGLELPERRHAAHHLIQLTLRAVVAGREDPVDAASLVYERFIPVLEDVRGRLFASPTRMLPDSIGSSCGLEMVLCWLRELTECRAGSRILVHTDLPRAEADRRIVGYLSESIHEWVMGRRVSA